MVSEKTPGTDGLPYEFYKVFWNDIREILIKALNYSYDTGNLSISQRCGIVKLIPKKDDELTSIKNWRPITLVNCDITRLHKKPLQVELRLFFLNLFLKTKQVLQEAEI